MAGSSLPTTSTPSQSATSSAASTATRTATWSPSTPTSRWTRPTAERASRPSSTASSKTGTGEQGISRIEIHANIDVGGYTWATQGYNFADDESAEHALGRLRDIQGKIEKRAERIRGFLRGDDLDDEEDVDPDFDFDDDGELAELSVDYFYNDELNEANRAALDDLVQQLNAEIDAAERILEAANNTRFGRTGFPRANDIASAGRTPGHGSKDLWIGKRAMLGSDWQGVKWL